MQTRAIEMQTTTLGHLGGVEDGLLTGSFEESTTFASDDWRSQSPLFQGETFRRNLQVVRELARFDQIMARAVVVGGPSPEQV